MTTSTRGRRITPAQGKAAAHRAWVAGHPNAEPTYLAAATTRAAYWAGRSDTPRRHTTKAQRRQLSRRILADQITRDATLTRPEPTTDTVWLPRPGRGFGSL